MNSTGNSGQLPSRGSRDLRIDFFRGLAIYMILVDHIHLNPFGKFTYHSLGLSDAAEIFVFLSGLSCGLAYLPLLERSGNTGLVRAVLKRALIIYAVYCVASVATYAIVSGMGRDFAAAGFEPLPEGLPRLWPRALEYIADLDLQPPLPSVLILYVALTVCLVPAFVMASERGRSGLLLLSGLVWGYTQLHSWHVPYFPYFNPFGWQFLFAIGLYWGLHSKGPSHARTDWLQSRPVLSTAWALVAAGFVIRLSMYAVKQKYAALAPIDPLVAAADIHKYNLSILRIAHFLSVAVLARAYIPNGATLTRFGGHFLIAAGRQALPVFALSTILSTTLSVVLAHNDFGLELIALLNAGAIAALTAASAGLLRLKQIRGRLVEAQSPQPLRSGPAAVLQARPQ